MIRHHDGAHLNFHYRLTYAMLSLTTVSLLLFASTQIISAIPVASSSSATTTYADAVFPTNIGHLGATATGAAPFLAQTDDFAAKTGIPTKTYTYPQPWESAQAYDHKDSDESIYHYMGSLSPYYVGEGWGLYDYSLPDQCKIEKVELISRHGSRYSTKSSSTFSDTLIAAGNFTAYGDLEFLNGWSSKLGSNILTSLGNQQLFDKGVRTFFRYGGLYDFNEEKIVVRTTSQERMTMSALYFLTGYFGLNWENYANLEIIVEDDGFNNTLSPKYACPNSDDASDLGDTVSDALRDHYLNNAVDRFNAQLEGNLTLAVADVYDMQQLCAYETNTLGYSKFCSLFSQEEWEWYGYLQDINFFYGDSYGNPVARAAGIGAVTELQQRLTKTPYNASFQSTQNSTLNSDPAYFPLDQSLYIDFTHDTIIVNILTALGFQQFNSSFDFSGPRTDKSTFKSSQLVPFGAQLSFEVIACDEEVPVDRSAEAVSGSTSTQYIHAILNDHTLSLSLNVPEYCESRVDGWCKLDKFVEYLDTLWDAAEYEKSCYGDFNLTRIVTNGVPLN